MNNYDYDAIVVGGGHAGMEAAFSLAKRGHKTLIIAYDWNKIASMPCNPSIGGPAKGIITVEIDALGGMQGLMADQAMIQIKMLNVSKGPAVQALRAQIDKEKYTKLFQEAILKQANLTFLAQMVVDLLWDEQQVNGVKLGDGRSLRSQVVILTNGTYMGAEVLRGSERVASGPDQQPSDKNLSSNLQSHGIALQRLKTGTPPRVKASSIDFSQVQKEELPILPLAFSRRSHVRLTSQVACYLTYTNAQTHAIIRENLRKSTMYSGQIVGVGPRYCPSIEDKVVRFQTKDRHQVFYEPETKDGAIIYVQGFSSAMPIEVQNKMLRTLPGMAQAEVVKWAYAIEYDAIDPIILKPSLAHKKYENLFFAGQINGTSGYEEAAAQGLMAGINASLKLRNQEPLVLGRAQAYIGVLIDDLVTKGTNEPYRMLTSRAEYRLLLRHDNADERLSKIGYDLGLISQEEYQSIQNKYQAIASEIESMAQSFISANDFLAKKYQAFDGPSRLQLLMRPEVNPHDVSDFSELETLVTRVRLAGYIKKQATMARKLLKLDQVKIPSTIDYQLVPNLAYEARQKLLQIRPLTIGQASRIAGINPADIQMLMVYIEMQRQEKKSIKFTI